jgi:hypothetical protein
MTAFQPDNASLSYSARFCRRCGATMDRRSGLLGRSAWRCGQCKPAPRGH